MKKKRRLFLRRRRGILRSGISVLMIALLLVELLPLTAWAAPVSSPLSLTHWLANSSIRSEALLAAGGTKGTSATSINLDTLGLPLDKLHQHIHLADAAATGPETTMTASTVTTSVYAPVLDPVPSTLHIHDFPITGTAAPGGIVTLYYSQGGFEYSDNSMADSNGRFSITAHISKDGTYAFAATQQVNGVTSDRSVPISVQVDLPPDAVNSCSMQVVQTTSTSIEFKWSPPGNSDLDHYLVKRDRQLIATVKSPDSSYTDTGLQPETGYCYDITAVDAAGNQSEPTELCTGSTPADKLLELSPWDEGYNTHPDLVMSRDGSTIVYNNEDISDENYGNVYMYYLDMTTGKKVNIRPTFPDGTQSTYDTNPAVNSDGKVIAFSGYDDDRSVYSSDIFVYDRSNSQASPTVTDITYGITTSNMTFLSAYM